jgi:hypothetical protein
MLRSNRATVGHRTRLLVVLLRACGQVKQSGLRVIPEHVWAHMASKAGWVRQARV